MSSLTIFNDTLLPNATDLRCKYRLYLIQICLKWIKKINPDYVFHLAAQPIVSYSFINPVETWKTNVIGTINILDSLKELDNNCIGIIITSDKCYENQEWEWGYRESDRLGGSDPYSATKGAAELAFSSFYRSFFSDKSLTLSKTFLSFSSISKTM